MLPTKLFEPIKINNIELKNRIVMTAIHLTLSDDGSVDEGTKEFYVRRAKGGAAMFIVGGIASDNYVGYNNMLRLDKEEFEPSYVDFNNAVHEAGALTCAQLLQTGRYGNSKFVEDDDSTISASAVASYLSGETPREMTKEEIRKVCIRAGEAAERAKRTGFDAVELTSGSGYMISQFLSPATNKRTDEYGGSFENRCRFGLEMINTVRNAVGKDFPLIVRVAGNEFINGGNNNEDCVEWCKLLEKNGVDMIDVTGGWHETQIPQLHGDVPRDGYTYLATAIKKEVSIPVLSANRHYDPIDAEIVLATEQADIIGMCRPLVADPDLPNKTKMGQLDEIRYCVACNQGCFANVFNHKPVKCMINGFVGNEALHEEDKKTKESKKMLVIGGGPGGCQFAIRAAQIGHKVTLWEKNESIGGQLDLISAPPGKSEFNTLKPYFETMLKKEGVVVEVNKEVKLKDVNNEFDAVVVATGSTPKKIKLPYDSNIPVYLAEDILQKKEIAGKNVIVIGGSSVGCETAAYMAHEASLSKETLHFLMSQHAEKTEKIIKLNDTTNRNISIIDIAKIGTGFDFGCGWPVLKDLKRFGVKMFPISKIKVMNDKEVILETKNRKTGQINIVSIPCDSIVMAVGKSPDNKLYEDLKDKFDNVYCIGDAESSGNMMKAIRQANELVKKFL